jgi:hydrogenase expression/formation protein HypE
MSAAAAEVGVPLVTGDTKVVERGQADGLFITTTGLGRAGHAIDPRRVRPGDRVLLSGRLAEHGLAIMALRAGLELEGDLRSDSAPLHGLVADILAAGGVGVHVLRDPTRGGLASALNELAETAGCACELSEAAVPLAEEVRGACELLGLDPLYVANEGKLVAVVAAEQAPAVLEAMRGHPLGREAADIGKVVSGAPQVRLESLVGGWRVVDMLSGEQLPRIC